MEIGSGQQPRCPEELVVRLCCPEEGRVALVVVPVVAPVEVLAVALVVPMELPLALDAQRRTSTRHLRSGQRRL